MTPETTSPRSTTTAAGDGRTPPPGDRERTLRRRRTLFTSAAVAVLAVGVGLGVAATGWNAGALAEAATPTATQPAATATQPLSFADLIQRVKPAVISVKVTLANQQVADTSGGPGGMPVDPFQQFFGQQFGQQFFGRQFQFPPNMGGRPQGVMVGEGSGFFISADGTAVTANHVVENAKTIEVTTSDGKTYKAHVVGTDPGTDVAVIKVDGGGSFASVQFADQAPRVGDWVIAIGNPYGLGDTATAGIVSALARNIGTSTYDNFMQIDAPINRGNSGGPTFDVNGNVVGINDAIYTPSGGSVGIGFDIPANTAKTVTAELQKSGHVTRGYLGVSVQNITPTIAEGLGVKDTGGALVASAETGSPAAKAGIAPGDVITAVNGTAIKDARGLAQEIAGLAPGTSVKLDVMHAGKSRTVTLAIGEMPNQMQQPPA